MLKQTQAMGGGVMSLDGTVKDEIRLLPDMTKGRYAGTDLSTSNCARNCKPTQRMPNAWIAAIHSLPAKKASKLGVY
jgi:hypothetical protein